MRKIIIFGNSGSGKSTLAKKICASESVGHVDLDTLAWLPTSPPERKPIDESKFEIDSFIASNQQKGWVIEGCYSDLIKLVVPASNELIFLDLPIDVCVENAKRRPWEPHKYESKEAQDANLDMLLAWIRQYEERGDTFSKQSHEALFESYIGNKSRMTRIL